MDDYLSLLALILGLVFLACTVSLLVPLKFLGIPSRKRAALYGVLALAGLGVIGNALPDQDEVASNGTLASAPAETSPAAKGPASRDTVPATEPNPVEPASVPASEPEFAQRIVRPSDVLGVDVTLRETTGLIDQITVHVADGRTLLVPESLAVLYASVPEPGWADRPNVTISTPIPGSPAGGQIVGTLWNQLDGGDDYVWRGSAWSRPFSPADVERQSYYEHALVRLLDEGHSDEMAGDLALMAVRTQFEIADEEWPLPLPGTLIRYEDRSFERSIEQAAADDIWVSRLQDAVDGQCFDMAACVYRRRLDIETTVACQGAIDRLVLTDTDWPFFANIEERFSRFRFADGDTSRLQMFGDLLRVESVGGSWVDHIYMCEISSQTGQVLNVALEPGRF